MTDGAGLDGAALDESGLQAPITAVTVFRDGARVVRTGTLTMPPGLRTITMGNLPHTVDPASVRLAARGSDLALLSVESRREFRPDPLREDTARLRADVESKRDAVQALDDEDAAEQARLGFAGHVSEAAATALARAIGFGRADHEALAQMAGHLAADTSGALARRRDIAARKRAAGRELEAAERRLALAEQRAGQVAEVVELSAILEASAQTEAEVEFSYHVSGASWRALYDLGLSGERLTVGYLAEVTQRTGEDWPEVELVLSTARRGLHQELPELRPWYIGRSMPAPMRQRAAGGPLPPMQSLEITAAPAGAAQPLAFAAQAARAPQAPPIVAEADEAGLGLVYQIPRPLAVPSDGNPHKATVARFELDATLDHLAVPVLAAEAYLRATVSNGSRLLLLPGPARIFREGQFVGETALETVASGEEFELHLGVDDEIRVERELRRRSTGKAVIGGNRTVEVAYEITVRNHRPGPAKIRVHDHIPVSTDGDIKVRLRETSPAPAEQDDLGELTWDLSLDPGQEATIRYRFTVDHPAQVHVAGL